MLIENGGYDASEDTIMGKLANELGIKFERYTEWLTRRSTSTGLIHPDRQLQFES